MPPSHHSDDEIARLEQLAMAAIPDELEYIQRFLSGQADGLSYVEILERVVKDVVPFRPNAYLDEKGVTNGRATL